MLEILERQLPHRLISAFVLDVFISNVENSMHCL